MKQDAMLGYIFKRK